MEQARPESNTIAIKQIAFGPDGRMYGVSPANTVWWYDPMRHTWVGFSMEKCADRCSSMGHAGCG
jgi:hypothetical protein